MRRMIAGIGGLGLAVVLSQFPEYAQQYTQRLGGAVDELRIITTDFDRAAEAGGLDRAAALERYNASKDQFLAGRGSSMTGTFQRFEQLSATVTRIENAGPVERFQSLPAIPVTVEGILYAGGGFILGYLIFSGLWRFLAMPFKKRYPAYR